MSIGQVGRGEKSGRLGDSFLRLVGLEDARSFLANCVNFRGGPYSYAARPSRWHEIGKGPLIQTGGCPTVFYSLVHRFGQTVFGICEKLVDSYGCSTVSFCPAPVLVFVPCKETFLNDLSFKSPVCVEWFQPPPRAPHFYGRPFSVRGGVLRRLHRHQVPVLRRPGEHHLVHHHHLLHVRLPVGRAGGDAPPTELGERRTEGEKEERTRGRAVSLEMG